MVSKIWTQRFSLSTGYGIWCAIAVCLAVCLLWGSCVRATYAATPAPRRLAAEIATEDALQQTTAEQAFADGERLQKQATAESLRQAIVKYEQARSLMRAGGDVRGEAIVLNNIGLAYNSLGERQMALDFFQQALPLLQAIGDRREEANTLNNLGRTHIEMRDLPKALDVFHRARLLAQAIDDRVGEAASLANRGSK